MTNGSGSLPPSPSGKNAGSAARSLVDSYGKDDTNDAPNVVASDLLGVEPAQRNDDNSGSTDHVKMTDTDSKANANIRTSQPVTPPRKMKAEHGQSISTTGHHTPPTSLTPSTAATSPLSGMLSDVLRSATSSKASPDADVSRDLLQQQYSSSFRKRQGLNGHQQKQSSSRSMNSASSPHQQKQLYHSPHQQKQSSSRSMNSASDMYHSPLQTFVRSATASMASPDGNTNRSSIVQCSPSPLASSRRKTSSTDGAREVSATPVTTSPQKSQQMFLMNAFSSSIVSPAVPKLPSLKDGADNPLDKKGKKDKSKQTSLRPVKAAKVARPQVYEDIEVNISSSGAAVSADVDAERSPETAQELLLTHSNSSEGSVVIDRTVIDTVGLYIDSLQVTKAQPQQSAHVAVTINAMVQPRNVPVACSGSVQEIERTNNAIDAATAIDEVRSFEDNGAAAIDAIRSRDDESSGGTTTSDISTEGSVDPNTIATVEAYLDALQNRQKGSGLDGETDCDRDEAINADDVCGDEDTNIPSSSQQCDQDNITKDKEITKGANPENNIELQSSVSDQVRNDLNDAAIECSSSEETIDRYALPVDSEQQSDSDVTEISMPRRQTVAEMRNVKDGDMEVYLMEDEVVEVAYIDDDEEARAAEASRAREESNVADAAIADLESGRTKVRQTPRISRHREKRRKNSCSSRARRMPAEVDRLAEKSGQLLPNERISQDADPRRIGGVSATAAIARRALRKKNPGKFKNGVLYPIMPVWRQSYAVRTHPHTGYFDIDYYSLAESTAINCDAHPYDDIPWEDRDVKQQFLHEKSISFVRNWFGNADPSRGNDRNFEPVCHPNSMPMPLSRLPLPYAWDEAWYMSWKSRKDNPNALSRCTNDGKCMKMVKTIAMGVDSGEDTVRDKYAIENDDASFLGTGIDDAGDINDTGSKELKLTPEFGTLCTVRLKAGEPKSRINWFLTSRLAESRWRRKHFPYGSPYD